jgi:hypothetical protein
VHALNFQLTKFAGKQNVLNYAYGVPAVTFFFQRFTRINYHTREQSRRVNDVDFALRRTRKSLFNFYLFFRTRIAEA